MNRKVELGHFKTVANLLGCRPEVIMAIYAVETPREPFDSSGFPSILYERHVFYRNAPKAMRSKWMSEYPTLCNSATTTKGGYGSYAMQRSKFSRAFTLDKRAAMMACSWGAFQELGENYEGLGFDTVDEFVDQMKSGIEGQLDILVRSLKMRKLSQALKSLDWQTIAKKYNGIAYKKWGYDTQLATEYSAAVKAQIDWSSIDELSIGVPVEKPTEDVLEKPNEDSGDNLDQNLAPVADPPAVTEQVAVEKPAPMGFWKGLWQRVLAFTGTNISTEVVSQHAQQVQALGLPSEAWRYLVYIVLFGTIVALLGYIYSRVTTKRRDELITKLLIESNSGPHKTVQLVDSDLLPFYEAKGFTIVRR